MQVPCRVQRCPSCNTYGKPLIGKGLPCSILVGTGTKMQHGPTRSSTGLHTSTHGTDGAVVNGMAYGKQHPNPRVPYKVVSALKRTKAGK